MVVAQLLRGFGTVVKGGRNLEIRYGLAATRASSDLDTVRTQSFDDFLAQLRGAWSEVPGSVAVVVQNDAGDVHWESVAFWEAHGGDSPYRGAERQHRGAAR